MPLWPCVSVCAYKCVCVCSYVADRAKIKQRDRGREGVYNMVYLAA